MKFRVPELFLGALLSVAIFSLGMIFSPSLPPAKQGYGTDDKKADSPSKTESKHDGFWDKAADDPVAYFTLWLVGFTGVLAISTIGLWVVTGRGIGIQARDTRILQRAYIAVEPRGIRLRIDNGSIMGHVAIKNAGNLPARKLSWFINMKWSPKGDESDFPIRDGKGSIVITPGSAAIRGSGSFLDVQDLLDACNAAEISEVDRQRPVYIYVWGVIAYDDGFVPERATQFCHRYNWMLRDPFRYGIDLSHARLHEFGNDST